MGHAEINVVVTEVTLTAASKKKRAIKVTVNDRTVEIPVSDEIWTYANEQFFQKANTAQQKRRLATLMNIVRAAYLKGLADAASNKR